MDNKAYHSGRKEADNSQTPWWAVRQIQALANVNIVHDVCATDISAKANTHWSKEDDSLTKDWAEFYRDCLMGGNDAFYMNPPFSIARKFTAKAAIEAQNGVPIIGCVKNAPDADWFIEMEQQANYIFVPDGRIQFQTADGSDFMRFDKKRDKWVKSSANFPICFPLWLPYPNGGLARHIRFNREKQKYGDVEL